MTDDECIHTLSNDSERQLKCRMLVGLHKVRFQVDTGATVNTLPARYVDGIKPTTNKLKMWNNTDDGSTSDLPYSGKEQRKWHIQVHKKTKQTKK